MLAPMAEIFDAPPTLHDASPADGAQAVVPRARLVLRFDRPMNPASVEQALRLEPPAAGAR